MLAAILGLILGAAGIDDQALVDAIVKARIELARQASKVTEPVKAPEKPKLDLGYAVNRERAIKENKVLLVLVGGSEVKQCDDFGCKPIPSNWILYRVKEFQLDKELVKTGIIVSSPKDKELWYLKTLPDQATIPQIDNVINPIATVRERHLVPCPTCPSGWRYID